MVVTVVTLLCILVAVTWKVHQCTRARLDFPMISVTLALSVQLLVQAYPLVFGSDDASARLLGLRTSQFLQAALIIAALFWLKMFFQSSARAGVLTKRRFVAEAVVAVVAVGAVGLAAALQTPVDPAVLGRSSVSDNGASHLRFSPGLVGVFLPFYAVSGAYYVWATGSAARNALWSARHTRSHLRAGLVITGIGLSLVLVGAAGRVALAFLVWIGIEGAYGLIVLPSLCIAVGLPMFFVGVIYPGMRTRLSAGRIWTTRFREFHALRSLWDRMHQAFPQHAFVLTPRLPWLQRAGLLRLAQNHYRRVIEIHDGLMMLSCYVDPADVGDHGGPHRQADLLVRALGALHDGVTPADHACDLGIARGARTLDTDARALVALARALTLRTT